MENFWWLGVYFSFRMVVDSLVVEEMVKAYNMMAMMVVLVKVYSEEAKENLSKINQKMGYEMVVFGRV